ncbi:MAG: potassium channel family protein [Candidatus Thermoplasmatota archaeon]|nr:potassium channel family protein [Candidatus Thermoplasmatota archaeon]
MKSKLFNWSNLRVQLFVALSALVGMIAVGTVVYHHIEGWTWIDSFYFSVCSMTTVGYGDLVPTTEGARLFTAFYVLVGVAVAFTALGVLGANYLRRSQEILLGMRSAKESEEIDV